MNKKNSWIIFILSAGILLAGDLLFKSWAVENLDSHSTRMLIDGFLGLRYTVNHGAAFSFLADFNARWPLAVLKFVLLCGILWYYNRIPREKIFWALRVPVILIFAGGLGNLIDRVYLGYVRDMLEFQFINFPIFNLADVYVTAGVYSLLFVTFFVVKEFPFP